ncbi:MAG TPA: type II secretion system protein GspL [Steroidobacteraceae bacterium]|nr:type II secretion system protein GspL [Steroidobacteraceae bacterium]
MPLTLLLRLPTPGQTDTEWLTVDETGAPAGPRQSGPLALAAAVGATARIVVLAPATQVLLAEADLPPGGGAKLARAVPFALEEQLTEDIDQLYFAVGRRTAAGKTPVAVVSRAIIEAWLASLKAAGIAPLAMYPDISLMPENPGQTVLWLEKDRLAVRRPGSLPFAVELTPVTEALVVAGVIAALDDESAHPKPSESAILYLSREDWLRVQDEFEGLIDRFESLRVQLLADGPLPWLGREIRSGGAVNLLQGEFAAEADYGARWRQWRVAAALAAALLVVHVGAEGLQLQRAKRQTAELDAEIATVFTSAMPTEKPTDPRKQMEARLNLVRKSAVGPQYFLHAMQALGAAVSSIPKTSIDALSYREQTVDMKVTAASVDALSQLSQVIGKQGLSAEILSSTPAAGGVEAHIKIHAQTEKARQ